MAALESVRRESPASFEPSSVFASDESDDTDESDAPTQTGQNALVVHAPGFDREGVVGDVAAAASATRLGPDADATDPGETDSVVIEDLYARYGERDDGRAGGAATLDRLRERLDGSGTVVAFVEPYELDWLCRGEEDEAFPVEVFDWIVHLRYDADDTARGGDVNDAVTAATERLDDDIDASDGAVRATLSTYSYSYEYEHAPGTLAGETFGPAMVPGVVIELPSEVVTQAVSSDSLTDRLRNIARGGALGEFFQSGGQVVSEAAASVLGGATGTALAASLGPPGIGAGAALALWLWLDDDDEETALERLLDQDGLPATAQARLEAELEAPPGTVAAAQRLWDPETCQRLVEAVEDDGRLDEFERVVADHRERLDAHSERLDELESEVDALAELMRRRRDPDTTGFDRVTRDDFEHGLVDDEHCWRRAFTLAEAWAGYPLERERPLADGGRQELTEQLLDALADGGGAALLGAPGSGKTTATRTAMAEWAREHDDGTVFYRRKATTVPLDTEALETAIRSARERGPVLVAVEDAARRGSYLVYETVDEFAADDGVSFLVNSRESEWLDSDGEFREVYGDAQASADAARVQSEAFTPVNMPPLDEREVERFLDNYAAVTGDEVSLDGDSEAILSQIRGYEGVSPMLLLAYYLPVWRTETRVDTEVPALIENVREVFRFARGESDRAPVLSEDEQSTMERVALAVNVLNAAEVAVWREHLLGLGEDLDEVLRIDELLDELQGPLLFGSENQQYRTHHPLWSELYLSEHLDQASSSDRARLSFERCVNGLFALFDDTDRREAVARFLTETPVLDLTDESPERPARVLVTSVFEVGERRPALQPLYGTSDGSGLELPSPGGARVAVNAAFRRARMFNSRGEAEREREEIEWALEKAEEAGIDDGVIAANYHALCGHHARQQGDFETARDHYEQAREEASDESRSEAVSLNNLGTAAQSLGEYEQAREYHHQSLAIKREIGDRAGEAKSLVNLGVMAQSLGEYEQACEYFRESLAIEREIGDRAGEAKSLNNLGAVARSLGEYEQGREYHEESLAILREIGDRAGEATSLNNLGSVAGERENYEEAERRHREALAISEDIGDRSGVANQQYNVGVDAERQGDLERALEWFQRSKTTYAELGVDHEVLKCLESISRIAQRLDRTKTAREACEDALELIERSDLDGLDDRAREFRVRDARLDETPDGTLRLYYYALANALEGDGDKAARLFGETWERRDTHDEDSLVVSATLAAGVAFAAHLTLAAEAGEDDTADDETPNPDDVLVEIDPAELTTPATSLYYTLTHGVPSTTPATLREQADEIDPENFSEQIDVLERRAYARLIEALSETDGGGATAVERYERALFRLAHEGDPDAAVDTLASLWNERGDYDPGTDDHAAVAAAGVLLAGYGSSGEDVPVDAETVVQSVDPDATPLSDAVRAVYDALAGDEPDHTPDELHDRVDSLSADADLEQLETVVFASVLSSHTGDDTSPTEERYRETVTDIARGDTDTETALTELHGVWTHHDDPETDADGVTVAAGVALAAYAELTPDQTAAVVDDPDALPPRENTPETPLPDAVRALRDHLAGDDPETTPDELKARVDDRQDPAPADTETLVFARLLTALRSD